MRKILVVVLALPAAASAELARFDANAKIFSKWLYRNNDRGGALSYGNPFWPENFSGDNGVASEADLVLTGQVSDLVTAGVRLQSRFGTLWQDYWENGDVRYGGVPNTSGETLGMDHAEYLKLRAFYVRMKPPIPWVKTVHAGSSDLSQFNLWTLGKVRYIDRDNPKGVFVQGAAGPIEWTAAAVALPKLWAGPGWSTGLGEDTFYPQFSLTREPFWQSDWAYAARATTRAVPDWTLALTGVFSNDVETDLFDPDAQGTLQPPDARCGVDGFFDPAVCPDGAVDRVARYRHHGATLEGKGDLLDGALAVDATVAWAGQRINKGTAEGGPGYAANGVALNGGVFPMPYKDTDDLAVVVRAGAADLWRALGTSDAPFGLGVTAEYFNIGAEYNALLGARREADVLLTDGFLEGGQLPSLNLANEFMDFDEPWFESCIGWHGGTLVADAALGDFTLKGEYTFIGYNTNRQDRAVNGNPNAPGTYDQIYPTFLHSEGRTDTDLYDYANPPSMDRGRDPRSVYRRDQQRFTHIGVLRAGWLLGAWELGAKVKYIRDADARQTDYAADRAGKDRDRAGSSCPAGRDEACDDYLGNLWTARIDAAFQANDELKITLGAQVDAWSELNRQGTRESGYSDYFTFKARPFLKAAYAVGGAVVAYQLEYLRKDLFRERAPELQWNVVRSKMTLEVAW
jgi:hypothetical protein